MKNVILAMIYVVFVLIVAFVAMAAATYAVNLNKRQKKHLRKVFAISMLATSPILFTIVYLKSVIPNTMVYIVDLSAIMLYIIVVFVIIIVMKRQISKK